MRFAFLRLAIFFSFALIGCRSKIPQGGSVVIALSADADILNPLFASGSNSQTFLYFLYPDLIEHRFNEKTGRDSIIPALARTWTWSEDGRSLTYHLRTDRLWSDGKVISAKDIEFSYQLYLNPKSGAIRRGKLSLLDSDKPVTAVDDSTLMFRFQPGVPKFIAQDQTTLGFIANHRFDSLEIEKIRSSPLNKKPVSGKYFKLESWLPKQEMVLKKDPLWLPSANLDRILFKIIPDAQTRLVELKTGNVDLIEGISPDDARELNRNNPEIRIEKQSLRRVEFIGWNSIDPAVYKKTKIIKPHPLFGDARVRRALTLAINRDEILQSTLGEFGQLATGAISPAFRWAYNDTLHSPGFSMDESIRLFAAAGWSDHDGDGVIDKNGVNFEFTLTTNSGNDRRMFVLQKVQSDLRKIGIRIQTKTLETNTFNTGLRNREWDAFITGWTVNLIPDLQSQFGSDLEKNPLNGMAYQSGVVDSLLRGAARAADETAAGEWLKKIQVVINEDQPVTFLYWYDHLIAIRSRLQGVRADMISPYHHFWEWYVKP